MAQKVIAYFVDDTDGSEADETVKFMLDGVDYAIDLSASHAQMLRERLAEFVKAARRTGGQKPSRTKVTGSGRQTTSSADPQAVRDWARGQGLQVSDRGRLSNELVSSYLQNGLSGTRAVTIGTQGGKTRRRAKKTKPHPDGPA